MNRTTATCIAGMRSKTTTGIKIHFQRRKKPRGRSLLRGFGLDILAKRLRWRPERNPSVTMGSWVLLTGLASLFAGDFSGMFPEPTGTTAIATNPGYANLFADLGAGSLAVGIALVVLIPFLRKLITDKAETLPVAAATVVPVA